MKKDSMELVEIYMQYRQAQRQLNGKVLQTCPKETMLGAAQALGILEKKNEDFLVVLGKEDDADVVGDFANVEYRGDSGKTVIEIYREQIGTRDEMEKEILEAMICSQTSLFRITDVIRDEKLVVLEDILNKKDGIRLIDRGLGETAKPKWLIFLRLLRFKAFAMSSGFSFVFHPDHEPYLRRKCMKTSRNLSPRRESLRRFLIFFKLNQELGEEIRYSL
jgi:hypothetical protein